MRRTTALLLCVGALLHDAGRPAVAAEDTALLLANVNASNTAYARVANSSDFSLQTFTLEAWVQRLGTGYGFATDPSGPAILAKPREGMSGSNIASWHFDWTNTGQILFNLTHTVGTSGVYLATPAVATPLQRHHIAASFDGTTVRLYVDGVLRAQTAWALGSVYYGADDVLIGAANFGLGYLRRFDGYIDDVRIWDYARSEGEIATYMNCRLAGSEKGLVAYWTFDGSDLLDESGHGHNGTVQGVAGSLSYAPLAPLGSCLVGVEERSGIALSMSLSPRPARDRVTIRFELPKAGDVVLEWFDVAGRRRGVVPSRYYPAGRHELSYSFSGSQMPGSSAGLYFLRLRFGGDSIARPIVLLH
jgi:hypothetical protein